MTTATIPQAEAKSVRKLTRRQGLFAPELLKTALVRSVIMFGLDIPVAEPCDVQWSRASSPVLYTIAKVFNPGGYAAHAAAPIVLDFGQALTLFANFAECWPRPAVLPRPSREEDARETPSLARRRRGYRGTHHGSASASEISVSSRRWRFGAVQASPSGGGSQDFQTSAAAARRQHHRAARRDQRGNCVNLAVA